MEDDIMMFELNPIMEAWRRAVLDTVEQTNRAIKRRPGRRKSTSELKRPRQRVIKDESLLLELPGDSLYMMYRTAVVVSRPMHYPHDHEAFEEPWIEQTNEGAYVLGETLYGKQVKFPPAP